MTPREKGAWQSALASVILVFIGLPLEFVMSRNDPFMPRWSTVVALTVSTLLLVYLMVMRHRTSTRAASIVFLLNNLAVAINLLVTSQQFIVTSPHASPFQSHKLAMVAVALLAPPERFVGITVISSFAGVALLAYGSLPESLRVGLPSFEPWPVIAHALFSIALLLYRLRQRSLEESLARSHAEAALLHTMAKRFLAVRDLANSPLQTFEANTALVARLPGGEPYAERMNRALERLRVWHRILQEESAALEREAASESFDAEKLLAGKR